MENKTRIKFTYMFLSELDNIASIIFDKNLNKFDVPSGQETCIINPCTETPCKILAYSYNEQRNCIVAHTDYKGYDNEDTEDNQDVYLTESSPLSPNEYVNICVQLSYLGGL